MECQISFVIPAYNAGKYIGRCINSILKLRHEEYEIIVIDDGSRDHTAKLVEEIKTEKVKYFYQNNQGVSVARNTGLRKAVGRYVMFVDSDDEIIAEHVDDIWKYVDSGKESVIAFDFVKCNSKGEILQSGNSIAEYSQMVCAEKLAKRYLDFPMFEDGTTSYLGAKVYQYFFRTEFLKGNHLEFPAGIHYAEDLCFCYDVMMKAGRVCYLQTACYQYHVIEVSVSHQFRKQYDEDMQKVYEHVRSQMDLTEERLLYYRIAALCIRYHVDYLGWRAFRRWYQMCFLTDFHQIYVEQIPGLMDSKEEQYLEAVIQAGAQGWRIAYMTLLRRKMITRIRKAAGIHIPKKGKSKLGKIGLLTFHKSINYGSVLQAYALQQTIVQMEKYMGESVGEKEVFTEIIDYKQKNYQNVYGMFRKITSMAEIRYNGNQLRFLPLLQKRKKSFEAFQHKHLKMGKISYQYGDCVEKWGDQYEVLLCGSDQIWNPNARDFDRNYFFPFSTNARKVSYAVSLNGGFLTGLKDAEEIKREIQDFSALSVREKSGADALSGLLEEKRNISICVDPTLLQEASVYERLCEHREIHEKYIFLYSVNFNRTVIRAAEMLSNRTGLPVYTLFTGYSAKNVVKTNGRVKIWKKNVGPEAFLSLIRYAESVVTNSFHGTAFSIIFEKTFFSVGSLDRDGTLIRDERICGLLDALDLSERFMSCVQLAESMLQDKIDYRNVNERKSVLVRESKSYLCEALRGEQI